jgi:hypothetical protein
MIDVSIKDGTSKHVDEMVALLRLMVEQDEPVLLSYANVYVEFSHVMSVRGADQVTTMFGAAALPIDATINMPRFKAPWLLHVAVDSNAILPANQCGNILTALGDIKYDPQFGTALIKGHKGHARLESRGSFTIARLRLTQGMINQIFGIPS